MLEDSLDHGGEHFDDHHGPGPLSAVLGRQEDMVSTEPVGPCSFFFLSKTSRWGWDFLVHVLILKSEVV